MTIPDFQTIMLPLLIFANDDREHHIHEAVEKLSIEFSLSEDENNLLLSSGQPVFYNRVGWARTYLKKAGILQDPRRGYLLITERGKEILREPPQKINIDFLKKFPEFVHFRRTVHAPEEDLEDIDLEGLTPEEALENSYQRIRRDLAEELLEYVLNSSPGFFEKLVVELLVKMGYGGSQRDAARAVGQSGDEGIDGIIDEDKLGLDTIYIQAKKWNKDTSIGRPEIQRFVGALEGKRARKGIFITTAGFSKDAQDYVKNINTKVVLIDGNRLSDLMIDFGIGVSTRAVYEIKTSDSDYFGQSLSEE
jgi:restriction system protein